MFTSNHYSDLNVGVNSSIFHTGRSKVNNFDFCWLHPISFKTEQSNSHEHDFCTFFIKTRCNTSVTSCIGEYFLASDHNEWYQPLSSKPIHAISIWEGERKGKVGKGVHQATLVTYIKEVYFRGTIWKPKHKLLDLFWKQLNNAQW